MRNTRNLIRVQLESWKFHLEKEKKIPWLQRGSNSNAIQRSTDWPALGWPRIYSSVSKSTGSRLLRVVSSSLAGGVKEFIFHSIKFQRLQLVWNIRVQEKVYGINFKFTSWPGKHKNLVLGFNRYVHLSAKKQWAKKIKDTRNEELGRKIWNFNEQVLQVNKSIEFQELFNVRTAA